jgi:chromosome segregation ATPase
MNEDQTEDSAELRRANQELARRLVRERVDFADRLQEALVDAGRSLADRDRLIDQLRGAVEARSAEMEALRAELETLASEIETMRAETAAPQQRLQISNEELVEAQGELDRWKKELELLHLTRAYRFSIRLRAVWKHPIVSTLVAPLRFLRDAVTPERTTKR